MTTDYSRPSRTTADRPTPPAPPPPGVVRTVMGGLLTLVLLSALDQTVMSTALATIARDVGAVGELHWLITAYLLPGTIAMPLYGKALDAVGVARPLGWSTVLLLAGSVLGAVAGDFGQLVAARALQGLGAAGLMTIAFTVTFQVATPRQRPFFQSLFGVVFSLASLVGPLLGGVLAATSWRLIFWLNVPLVVLGGVAVAVALRSLPRNPAPRKPLDWQGGVLLVAAAGGWMTTATLLSRPHGIDVWVVGVSAVAALVATWLLIRREALADDPVVPPQLFARPGYTAAVAGAVLTGVLLFGAAMLFPLREQFVAGSSPVAAGLGLVPMMLAMLATSMVSGRLIGAHGRVRGWLLAGAVLAATSCGLAGLFAAAGSTWLQVGVVALFGAGVGMCMQNLVVVAQSAVEPRMMGAGTSLVTFARQVGATFGTAALGGLLQVVWVTGGFVEGYRAGMFAMCAVSVALLLVVLRTPASIPTAAPATPR